MNNIKKVGITGYGIYFPQLKISANEYQRAWGKCSAPIQEKTVMDVDEDILTMAVEAGKEALGSTSCPRGDIGAFAVASTNFPYIEKLNSSTVAAALGLPQRLFASDYSSSTKAASTALINMSALLLSGIQGGRGLLIASDAPEASLQENREHGFGAGAAAILLGTGDLIAVLEAYESSYIESLGERYTRRGNIFSEDIGVGSLHTKVFENAVGTATNALFLHTETAPKDYTYLCVGEHNPRLVKNTFRRLGFNDTQMKAGSIYKRTGDLGAAASLASLVAVLNVAQPGERILLVSYGSGAGVDALSFHITETINKQRPAQNWQDKLKDVSEIDYIHYMKLKNLLVR